MQYKQNVLQKKQWLIPGILLIMTKTIQSMMTITKKIEKPDKNSTYCIKNTVSNQRLITEHNDYARMVSLFLILTNS